MGLESIIDAIVVGLFVLFLLGILIYTIAHSRPRPQKELRGGDAILDAIQRYDRSTRLWRWGWYPTVFAVRRRRRSSFFLSKRK